jgi:hypothetical protein
MLLTFSAPRVWPKSRRVAPPPTLCASREWEGLPCRDRLQRKLIASGESGGRNVSCPVARKTEGEDQEQIADVLASLVLDAILVV